MRKFIKPSKIIFFALLLFVPLLASADGRNPEHAKLFFGSVFMLFFIFFTGIGVLAFSLLLSVLRPQMLVKGGEICMKKPLRCLGAGFLALVLYMLYFNLLKNFSEPVRGLAGVPALVVFAVHSLAGLAMMHWALGEKIIFNTGSRFTGSTFMSVLFGGSLLVVLNFLPIVGQIANLCFFCAGLGCAIYWLFQRSS